VPYGKNFGGGDLAMEKKRKYSKPKMNIQKLNPFFLACVDSAASGCSTSVYAFGKKSVQAGNAGSNCPC
jgi:hypothetical protein